MKYLVCYALCCTTKLPGLAVAVAIVDWIAKKRSMASLFVLCGLFLFPLVHSQREGLTTLLLFNAHVSIIGVFNILYIYALEVILSHFTPSHFFQLIVRSIWFSFLLFLVKVIYIFAVPSINWPLIFP